MIHNMLYLHSHLLLKLLDLFLQLAVQRICRILGQTPHESTTGYNRQNFRQNELNCKENICYLCSLQAFVIRSTSSQPCSWNILEGPAKYRLQPAALQSLGKHVFG
jgi:hypothetical protein